LLRLLRLPLLLLHLLLLQLLLAHLLLLHVHLLLVAQRASGWKARAERRVGDCLLRLLRLRRFVRLDVVVIVAGRIVRRCRLRATGLASAEYNLARRSLTSIANDTTFDQVFARQVEALGRRGDIVIGISTSGRSANVVEGLRAARRMELATVAMTGRLTQLEVVSVFFILPSPLEHINILYLRHNDGKSRDYPRAKRRRGPGRRSGRYRGFS